MLATSRQTDSFPSLFERYRKSSADIHPAWLTSIREAAIARFSELGFPTTRHEEWRHTNLAPIAGMDFEPAETGEEILASADIKPFLHDANGGVRIVLVNGCFSPTLSSLGALENGIEVSSLAHALTGAAPVIQANLTRHACWKNYPFAALNTAFIRDGAFVHVAAGAVIDQPISIVHFSTAATRPTVTHPRTLIVAEANSQVTIVEIYAGLGETTSFTNAVTELVVKENAVVDHYQIERESTHTYHIGTLHLHQYRSSSASSHAISLGGALVRNNIHALLDGEGCDCTLNGLYMLRGTQHVDNHLRMEHAKPNCDSRQFFKGVLDDHSHGVFTGRIIVHKDAQKTDGKQTNMNLLLSDNALADSKPQLEIFADDVKCTHGATIGQIDKEAIFYLRSRGIGATAARNLLVHAFANASLERIRVAPLRQQLEALVLERLSPGRELREAV